MRVNRSGHDDGHVSPSEGAVEQKTFKEENRQTDKKSFSLNLHCYHGYSTRFARENRRKKEKK